MKDNSFTSLIILLVLFFVLPSLFNLLGQYTLKSKGPGRAEDDEGEPQPPGETIPGHPEKVEPLSPPEQQTGRTTISNKPIHPGWF